MDNDGILLSVRNLSTHFFTAEGVVKAVQEAEFSIKRGQTFALVGESGCGKTATALSIMRLLPRPQGKIVGGEIVFEGRNLLALSERQMRRIRGNRIAMIFQEPMTSLNPVFTVGNQIAEPIKLSSFGGLRRMEHQKKSNKESWAGAVGMLRKVGIADAAQRARDYPHQLSGGMQQRVMIAMAVSCEPALLIADEPTTSLDVTIQAQILDLLDELQSQNGMSILLITHNLGIVAQRANDVAVMYASRIVEVADSQQLFAEPLHPYTQGLLLATARPTPRRDVRAPAAVLRQQDAGVGCPLKGGHAGPPLLSRKRLPTIPGAVPDPLHFPPGCKFYPRCPIGHADERCQTFEPPLRGVHPVRNNTASHTLFRSRRFSNGVKSDRCVRPRLAPPRRVACWYAKGYEEE